MSKSKKAHSRRPFGPNEQELHFAELLARLGNATEAARLAGYSQKSTKQVAYGLAHRPDIEKAILEARKRIAKEAPKTADQIIEGLREFGRRELLHRIRTAKTHFTRGDADVFKGIELLFKITKDIQPNQTINNNSAQAAALAGEAPKQLPHLHQSPWRIAALEAQTFGSEHQLESGVEASQSSPAKLPE